MFVALVLLYILCQSNGHIVRYRCSDVEEKPMSFTPVDDVLGRYTLETCPGPHTKQKLTLWDIELWYCKTCNKRAFTVHSTLKDQSIKAPSNCTNVCYSMMFDVIYSGCYEVHSTFRGPKIKIESKVNPKYPVNNSLTLDSLRNSKQQVVYIRRGNDVTLNWMLNVPVPNNYTVTIHQRDNETSTDWHPYPDKAVSCKVHNVSQLWCNLKLTPGKCYKAKLNLNVPWYPLLYKLTEIDHNFCHEEVEPPWVEGAAGGGAWWAAGGALLALCALLAALLARRAFREREYHKRVFEAWKRARECEASRTVEAEPESHNILLLYAREDEHGQRAVAALKALLQHSFDGQVLDVYAADVTARAAPAPGAWLRGALAAERTKVLLLQSPALRRLYHTALRPAALQLQEPLLGRGALYRRPHFGDQLVLLALRLMAESLAAHRSYHKYYLATYSGLSGELLPALVPFRRYELPLDAAALLHDVAGAAPDAPPHATLAEQFALAANEFIQHATDNPDYLDDELIAV